MQTPPRLPAPRPATSRPVTRAAATAALTLSAGLLTTGCSALSPDDGRRTAQQVAAALSAGSLGELGFANVHGSAAQAEFERVTRNLSGLTASVEAGPVAVTGEEDRRAASLSWSWHLPGVDHDWQYESRLELVRDEEGRWLPQWAPDVVEPSLAPGQGLQRLALFPDRGDVLGADGRTIVTERPIRRVGIDKSELDEGQASAAARRLAAVLEIDADAYAEAVEQAGPEAFVEALPLREADFRALDAQRMDAVPGLRVVQDELPLAPSRGFAADVLGSVAEATAEDLEEAGGELEPGSMIGRGGVQEAFDDRLRGEPGTIVQKVQLQEDGGVEPVSGTPLVQIEPVAGEPVELTLDPGLQEAASGLLADVESPSAIVAIRPSTGDVVVAANGPGSEGYSTALLGQYAPGSTFKLATALAMVREGDTAGTVVQCPPSLTVDGARFSNVESYDPAFLGSITLSEAMAHSCNTSFVAQHDRISQQELADAAAALGVGLETDLGVPAFFGSIPAEETGAEHAAALFGQGRTLVSPLTMANLAASAAAGQLVTPRLVATEGLLDEDPARPATDRTLTAQEAEQLRTTMRAVVTDGYLDSLQELDPDTAIGKTGTAEYGTEDPPRTHSWVVAEHEDLAVAVFVEDGDLGAITGAPIALDFLRAADRAADRPAAPPSAEPGSEPGSEPSTDPEETP
ncbi:MAG TPA: penicillin-binding transpeptidase domain-containing protein [Kocuria rosea]|nr:penicillin-binding transpeptidase domain-containing protein [Kocuria rosea]